LRSLIKNSREPEVSNFSLEINFGEVDCLQEGLLLIAVHLEEFRVVREVQHNISQFHISVDNAQFPNVLDSQDHLSDDYPGFFLSDYLSQTLEYS